MGGQTQNIADVFAQWIARQTFRSLSWLFRYKQVLKWAARLALTAYVGRILVHDHSSAQILSWATALRLGVSASSAFVLTVIFSGFLAYASHLGQTVANVELGFVEVSTKPERTRALIAQYANDHGMDNSDRIKVIAMRGTCLFADDGGILLKHLRSGLVDAVIPKPTSDNPTIVSRCGRENEDICREIVNAKYRILGASRNTDRQNSVWQHQQLCMWRVVIFNDACIVQPYLPSEVQSSLEFPAYVFGRQQGAFAAKSYYAIFDQMFQNLKTHSEEVHGVHRSMTRELDPERGKGGAVPSAPPGAATEPV